MLPIVEKKRSSTINFIVGTISVKIIQKESLLSDPESSL